MTNRAKASELESLVIGCKLRGLSSIQTADECKMGYRTVIRMVARPSFKTKLKAERKELVEDGKNAIIARFMIGMTALEAVAGNKGSTDTGRSHAGGKLVDAFLKVVEALANEDFNERLTRLEASQKADE